MIERIVIDNFKSLKHVDLRLGRLNLFIGTNASGKSNLFDALRVIQGIGNGFTIQEILDGKPRSATSEVWEPIRGESARAFFTGNSDDTLSFKVCGKSTTTPAENWEYDIGFSAREGRLRRERLVVNGEIYDSSPIVDNGLDPFFEVRYYGGKKSRPPHLKFDKNRPVLTQMARGGNGKWNKAHSESAERLAHALANMQRIDPSPAILRAYSVAHEINRMGERGENFAALVRRICADATCKTAYES